MLFVKKEKLNLLLYYQHITSGLKDSMGLALTEMLAPFKTSPAKIK